MFVQTCQIMFVNYVILDLCNNTIRLLCKLYIRYISVIQQKYRTLEVATRSVFLKAKNYFSSNSLFERVDNQVNENLSKNCLVIE